MRMAAAAGFQQLLPGGQAVQSLQFMPHNEESDDESQRVADRAGQNDAVVGEELRQQECQRQLQQELPFRDRDFW